MHLVSLIIIAFPRNDYAKVLSDLSTYQQFGSFKFVNIINTDLDVWSFLWVAFWWHLISGTKEFSFSELDRSVLPPIQRRYLLSSVVFFGNSVLCWTPFLPGAFSIWTVTISLLLCCVNILSLATLHGRGLSNSFTASFRLCRKLSKHSIAPRESDLNNRRHLYSPWSFSTSSDATE